MKKALSFVVFLALLLAMLPFSAMAATIESEGDLQRSTGNYTAGINDGDYVEAVNGFSDGPVKYYLITHDETKSGLTEVEYKGTVYQLEGVATVATDSFNFAALAFPKKDGSTANLLKHSVEKNFTLFFDDGTYIDSDSTSYTALSKENVSYIGLNTAPSGEPLATITRAARSSSNANINNTMERWLFFHKNIYIENLIFDGQGKDMYPVGGGSGAAKIPKSRGEYFICVDGGGVSRGADGFVMRDCILQNIGADNSLEWPSFSGADTRNKNIAINVLYNPGQVNIERVTVRNVKTTPGYGIIQSSYVDSLYFKDITIDSAMAAAQSRSVKIEQSGSLTAGMAAYVAPENQKVVFEGSLNLALDEMHDNIYVQDFRYKKISVPAGYKYAVWNMNNGGYTNPAFEIHSELPATAAGKSVQDIGDGCWLVNANPEATVTVSKQLTDILTVMNYAKLANGTPRVPAAVIKMYSATTIGSFALPAGYAALGAKLVAVKGAAESCLAKTLVPTSADAVISLPAANNATLFNFDFHEKSGLTIHEAVRGIEPLATGNLLDPLEGSAQAGYPKYGSYGPAAAVAPRVSNFGAQSSFVNCKFTVLAHKLAIDDIPAGNLLVSNEAHQLSFSFSEGYSNEAITDLTQKPIDDLSVLWTSSDPSIATVDANGLVTGLKKGTVIIYLKATDNNNNGEIEKPFAQVELEVKLRGRIAFEFVSQDQNRFLPQDIMNKLPDEINGFDGEAVTLPTGFGNFVYPQGTWKFVGWDSVVDTISDKAVTVVGTWKFEAAAVQIPHSFVSGSGGRQLPKKVVDLTPGAIIASVGTTVTASQVEKTTVDVEGGAWHFKGWKQDSMQAGLSDNNGFVGVWEFKDKLPPLPNTGDQSGTGYLLGIALISGMAAVAAAVAVKKKKA